MRGPTENEDDDDEEDWGVRLNTYALLTMNELRGLFQGR
jgi:hypothetical protein